MSTHMWNTAFQGVGDMLDGVDPLQAVATLAVIYAAVKLVHLVATSPVIPSVWVPLEPGECLKILPFLFFVDLWEFYCSPYPTSPCIASPCLSLARIFPRLALPNPPSPWLSSVK